LDTDWRRTTIMVRSAVADRANEEETEELRRNRPERDGPPEKRDHGAAGGGGSLKRITVNLIPRGWEALEQLEKLTGDSKTDIINRALQIYCYLLETTEGGGEVRVREPEDSEPQRVKIGWL
jgi:hypothetical protein